MGQQNTTLKYIGFRVYFDHGTDTPACWPSDSWISVKHLKNNVGVYVQENNGVYKLRRKGRLGYDTSVPSILLGNVRYSIC